jgi:hypothetical protein
MSDDLINRLRAMARLSGRDDDADTAVEAAQKIERLLSERQWIPVSERLPEVGVRVLVSNGRDASVGSREHPHYEAQYGKAEWQLDNWDACDPTHWMPLPAPPTASK